MRNDKVEIEVGAKGGKVSVSGPSASKISGQFGDLLSPFTELAGLAGDHIRIYRYDSITKHLKRAQEIASERGEDIKSVHPKNLIPWLENASLEDSESNVLTESWARLLLSGGEKFDSQLAVFTDSLKRLGPQEVQFLSKLGQISDGTSAPIPHLFSGKNRKLVSNLTETLIPKSQTTPEEIKNFAQHAMRNAGLSYGKIINGYFEHEGKDEEGFDGQLGSWILSGVGREDEDAASVLGKEALVEVVHVQGLGTIDMNVGQGDWLIAGQTTYVELTILGVDLLKRCDPKFRAIHGKEGD